MSQQVSRLLLVWQRESFITGPPWFFTVLFRFYYSGDLNNLMLMFTFISSCFITPFWLLLLSLSRVVRLKSNIDLFSNSEAFFTATMALERNRGSIVWIAEATDNSHVLNLRQSYSISYYMFQVQNTLTLTVTYIKQLRTFEKVIF